MSRFDLSPDVEITVHEKTLIAQRLGARRMITGHAMHTLKLETWRDHALDALGMALSCEVFAEKIDEQVHEIVESPTYYSPRHAFLASLPWGWRRLFFSFLWGLDPLGPFERRVTHRVTARRWERYPDLPPQAHRVTRIQEIVTS